MLHLTRWSKNLPVCGAASPIRGAPDKAGCHTQHTLMLSITHTRTLTHTQDRRSTPALLSGAVQPPACRSLARQKRRKRTYNHPSANRRKSPAGKRRPEPTATRHLTATSLMSASCIICTTLPLHYSNHAVFPTPTHRPPPNGTAHQAGTLLRTSERRCMPRCAACSTCAVRAWHAAITAACMRRRCM